MMTVDLTVVGVSCLLGYTNWELSTTGKEPSLGNYLHINQEDTIKYTLAPTTTLCA